MIQKLFSCCGGKSHSKPKNINDHKLNNIETNPKIEEIKTNNKHLICDDAFSNRLVLKKYLNMYKCDTDEAENGKDAIEQVKLNGIYKIIWMDLKMPKMDGIEATKYLRNEMHYEGIIIGLTGYVDDITVKQCLRAGMNYVIPKPFDKKVIETYTEKY
jgi:CheY-like chemotaxis protein